MTAPRITVASTEDDTFILEATSHSRTAPAGPRLFRANPPDIKFEFYSRAAAEKDCKILQDYLDGLGKARKTKRGAEEEAKETAPAIDLSDAWWMQ